MTNICMILSRMMATTPIRMTLSRITLGVMTFSIMSYIQACYVGLVIKGRHNIEQNDKHLYDTKQNDGRTTPISMILSGITLGVMTISIMTICRLA